MYPSKYNPEYGVFVKNTEDLLKDSGYVVSHSVVTKSNVRLFKIFKYLYCYLKTILLVMIIKFDCIYIHYITHTIYPIKLLKWFYKDLLIIGNAHGEDVCQNDPRYRKNHCKAVTALQFIDYLIVPSSYFKEYVIKKYNYPETQIIEFPSGGVNEKYFFPRDRIEACRKMQISPNFYYVGFISRIVKDKGWDIFLESINILRMDDSMKDVRFIIAGNGDEETLMDKRIKELNLSKWIIRYPALSQEKLGFVMNCLGTFCFPTRRESESLGLVALEAMRCGVICIISNSSTGPSTYTRNNDNAITFLADAPCDLAKKIKLVYLMKDNEREKIRKNAIETGKEYGSQRQKEKLEDVFSKIISGCKELIKI